LSGNQSRAPGFFILEAEGMLNDNKEKLKEDGMNKEKLFRLMEVLEEIGYEIVSIGPGAYGISVQLEEKRPNKTTDQKAEEAPDHS
jgi:hypothetical protein